MVYSSGVSSAFLTAQNILRASSATNIQVASRKIETSDPTEIDEDFLMAELGLEKSIEREDNMGRVTQMARDDQKLFAKPRGPGRRR
jgi:twinfilin